MTVVYLIAYLSLAGNLLGFAYSWLTSKRRRPRRRRARRGGWIA